MKMKPSKPLERLMFEINTRAEPRIAAALFTAPRKVPAVRFKNILSATDFSQLSMKGVQYAVSLGQKFSSAISLVHVVKPSSHFTGTEESLLLRDDLEVLELAESDVSRMAEEQSRKDMIVK